MSRIEDLSRGRLRGLLDTVSQQMHSKNAVIDRKLILDALLYAILREIGFLRAMAHGLSLRFGILRLLHSKCANADLNVLSEIPMSKPLPRL